MAETGRFTWKQSRNLLGVVKPGNKEGIYFANCAESFNMRNA